MAHPIHPELTAFLQAGVSCSYCKFCAERDISRRKREVGASPGDARRGAKASADGARRANCPGRRAGAKRPWGGGAGHDPRGFPEPLSREQSYELC